MVACVFPVISPKVAAKKSTLVWSAENLCFNNRRTEHLYPHVTTLCSCLYYMSTAGITVPFRRSSSPSCGSYSSCQEQTPKFWLARSWSKGKSAYRLSTKCWRWVNDRPSVSAISVQYKVGMQIGVLHLTGGSSIFMFCSSFANDFETYEVQVYTYQSFHPVYCLRLAYPLSPNRNSDPGSCSRLFSPPDCGPYLRHTKY